MEGVPRPWWRPPACREVKETSPGGCFGARSYNLTYAVKKKIRQNICYRNIDGTKSSLGGGGEEPGGVGPAQPRAVAWPPCQPRATRSRCRGGTKASQTLPSTCCLCLLGTEHEKGCLAAPHRRLLPPMGQSHPWAGCPRPPVPPDVAPKQIGRC